MKLLGSGSTRAETRKTYYDQPATAYASCQRSLPTVPCEGLSPGHGKLATSVGNIPHIPKSGSAMNLRNIHKTPTIKGIFLKLIGFSNGI
jgi:hypothetical protein